MPFISIQLQVAWIRAILLTSDYSASLLGNYWRRTLKLLCLILPIPTAMPKYFRLLHTSSLDLWIFTFLTELKFTADFLTDKMQEINEITIIIMKIIVICDGNNFSGINSCRRRKNNQKKKVISIESTLLNNSLHCITGWNLYQNSYQYPFMDYETA